MDFEELDDVHLSLQRGARTRRGASHVPRVRRVRAGGRSAWRRSAYHRGHRSASERGALADRHPDGCLHLYLQRQRHPVGPGRGQRAVEPGHAAGARRRPGLLRAAAHPRRSQRAAVPPERRHPARRHQRLRADAAAAHDRFDEADHGKPAGGVRPAQRRHHRSDHQGRRAAARRRRIRLRRQSRRDRAECQLRRHQRLQHLLRHRRHDPQRPRDRVPRRPLHPAPRPHQAVPRLRLFRAHLR